MNIERTQMVHVDLDAVGVRLNVFLCNLCDVDLDDVMREWVESEEEVSISNYFRLSNALDFVIEFHEMWAYGNALDEKASPLVMAMRTELLAMVERIDSLKFETPPITE